MKRSEMIKILRDALYKHCVYEYNDIADSDSDISGVLSIIEKAGMLPPFSNHAFFTDGDNANRKHITYRVWDEEDE